MWFEDILGYEVLDSRPEFLKWFTAWVSQRRNIVQKGVEPDIGDKLVIKGKRDAPLEPCFGTGYTQIR